MIDRIIQALIDARQPRSEFVELMEQFNDPYLVLIGCILSLRTNDKTTYPATLRMLKLAKTPQEMMRVKVKDLAEAIYPVGFYENKANWENNLLYYKDILVDFNKDSGENVIVKEGTKILAEGIFSNGDMTEVILPYSLKEIPKNAFYGCRKLVRVTAEVERVGENAFKYCNKLDEETKAKFNITNE